jgi:hypothetical protein
MIVCMCHHLAARDISREVRETLAACQPASAVA